MTAVEQDMDSTGPGAKPWRVAPLSRPLAMAIAVFYGLILAALPLMAFADRENYYAYAENGAMLIDKYLSISPLVLLANEPLWLLVNAVLGSFLTPEFTIRTIIFIPASLVAYTLLRVAGRGWPWMLVFLFLPPVLKNHITHLRQGLAVSVFLLGWYGTRSHIRSFVTLFCGFLHASFLFVFVLHMMTEVLRKLRLAADIRTIIFVGFGLFVGIGLAAIVSAVGARQAEVYEFSGSNVSGLGFLLWAGTLVVMFFQGRAYLQKHSMVIGVIGFYLATYFLIEVTGRIFESMLALVLVAILDLTGWRRYAVISVLLAYGVLEWYMRLASSGPAF